ncbi:MAG TPA: hypothetical protein VJK54_03305, partial [Chthoniobacterales bacterium]|nr:hypothetical protein [Chthoniobacterales bacterium]
RIINENEDNAFDNQSLLLANDSVPISHLPSSISYLGVTPKLMMDPTELKKIEEGAEAVGEALGIFERGAVTTQRTVVEPKQSRNYLETDRKNNINSFTQDSDCLLKLATESLDKETTEKAKGNKFLAELWGKSAAQYQKLAEYFLKAAETQGRENDVEAHRYSKIVRFANIAIRDNRELDLAPKALAKATAVAAEGNKSLVELWSQSAAQYQKLVEYKLQAVEAKGSGNKAEADRWSKIANSSKRSADWLWAAAEALEKAIEATAMGNELLAELWSKTATQYQESAEYNQKVEEAKLSENNEEIDRWMEVAVTAESSVDQLKLAAEALEKATAVIVKDNEFLADLWNKISLQYQEAAKYYRKAGEAKLSRIFHANLLRKPEGPMNAVLDTGFFLRQKSCLTYSSTPKSSSACSHEPSQLSCHDQDKISGLSENDEEGDHWEKTADFARQSAFMLKLAAKAFEEMVEATGKGHQALAELWNKTAEGYQEAAEYWHQATEVQPSINNVEADHWEKIGKFATESAYQFKSAAKGLEISTITTAKENQPLADLWSKISSQHQSSAEYYRRVAEAMLSGTAIEVERWEKAAEQHQKAAEYYQEAAEAKQRGNDAESNRCEKIANAASEYSDVQKVA